MQIHIKIIGFLLVGLALIHLGFPKYFNWKKELNSLPLISRQMMTVHTFFIALAILLMGLLCLTSPTELNGSIFGKRIAFGLGIFWTIRLAIQIFGYSSALWKG